MKTTLDLDAALLALAKAQGARERVSVTRLVEEGLRLRLRGRQGPGRRGGAPRLPVYRGSSGLAPGIDPCSNRAMLDAADDA
ncbi:MAG: DUF2191 domain-containing protein [Burkholderiales bacterium]|nr:DUF2191 domain-containing protein [Burkholderiales bacterium]